MVKLELEKLKEYCKSVWELEASVYSLACAKDNVEKLITSMKPTREIISTPIKAILPPPPIPPCKPTAEDVEPSGITIPLVICLVSVVVFIAFLIYMLSYHLEDNDFFILITILIWSLVIVMTYKVLSKKAILKKIRIKYNNDDLEYKKAIQKYENERIDYSSLVLKCEQNYKDAYDSYLRKQAEVNADFEKRIRVYNQLVEEVEQISITLEETSLQLEKLYERNVIYPKYRNLVAMAEIYEYLDSGRCTKLEETNGAYNLYEEEARLNHIITQIGIVIQNLKGIKENQYLLYIRLSDVKFSLDRLTYDIANTLTEVKGLKANSEDLLNFSTISSYCTKEIVENTKSINRLIAAGLYDN